ncbi:NAD(P)(+) transhydrogenase (Re/Si-specific) subunit beta [Gammaproteobacteria bacterium]|nr:NAD(P)(+) transhydrogenase (Re/Si-specific) subunit beta [Gammaproteobacteria bacterium]
MIIENIINTFYILSAILFILGIKMLSHPKSAKQGNFISSIGMFIAIVMALLSKNIISYEWIIIGIILGSLIGIFIALYVKMTDVPQVVALLNGFGGLSSLLVAWSFYKISGLESFWEINLATALAVVVGCITFTGSLIAVFKLHNIIPGRSLLFFGQKYLSIFLAVIILVFVSFFVVGSSGALSYNIFLMIIGSSLLVGVIVTIAISGPDMPIIISVLNSYSGIAAASVGFIMLNTVLIVTGSIIASTGMLLTIIMCKAMNRSVFKVIFPYHNKVNTKNITNKIKGEIKLISAEDLNPLIEASRSIVIIPGFGMAVAQAQHALKELDEFLVENGSDVKYAIHPVAGRMPGHMNVLLAEAGIEYDRLFKVEDVNPIMSSVDLCLVVGANDVVNSAANEDNKSPIYGMPIIEADKAKVVVVLKRTMSTGFTGIENSLFYKENCRMLFSDAKSSINALIASFKD